MILFSPYLHNIRHRIYRYQCALLPRPSPFDREGFTRVLINHDINFLPCVVTKGYVEALPNSDDTSEGKRILDHRMSTLVN